MARSRRTWKLSSSGNQASSLKLATHSTPSGSTTMLEVAKSKSTVAIRRGSSSSAQSAPSARR